MWSGCGKPFYSSTLENDADGVETKVKNDGKRERFWDILNLNLPFSVRTRVECIGLILRVFGGVVVLCGRCGVA